MRSRSVRSAPRVPPCAGCCSCASTGEAIIAAKTTANRVLTDMVGLLSMSCECARNRSFRSRLGRVACGRRASAAFTPGPSAPAPIAGGAALVTQYQYDAVGNRTVVIDANGQVTNIHAISGLPEGLTERAIEAAKQIKFVPAMRDGHPVSMWMELQYNFELY